MKIILNGQEKEFPESVNLKKMIEQLCRDTQPVIAEVNGEIIKRNRWDEQSLQNGDSVELVNFVGGG